MKAAVVASLLALLFFSAVAAAADRGGDITPPVLVAAAATRYRIDTSSSPQTITFTLHLTDDLSGVAAVHLELVHELGYNTARGCQVQPDAPARDGTLQCAITWPQYSAEARWLVTWFWMQDDVGNNVNLPAANCTKYSSSICKQFGYSESVSEAVRAIEVRIGPAVPGTEPTIYLPWLAR